MGSHTFDARLFAIRHYVLSWSRDKLAKAIAAKGAALPLDDGSELTQVTRDDIKRWERGEDEPSSVTKHFVAEVLGVPHEVLDPAEPYGDVSPQGLVALARARGLTRAKLNRYWKLTKQKALFKGNPGLGEWMSIIQQLAESEPPQENLFKDGSWCTHCGGWICRGLLSCPDCGNVE